MSRGSGRALVITTMVTHGESSGTGATELAGRPGGGGARRVGQRAKAGPGGTGLAGPPARAARRRAPDRRRRLLRAAELLDRVGARRHRGADRGAAGGR